jgi:hypothetical protein
MAVCATHHDMAQLATRCLLNRNTLQSNASVAVTDARS